MMFRSLIFVPGNNMRFVEKAKTLAADIVCLDLEDSVPINEKDAARTNISAVLGSRQEFKSPVYVRTNSSESGMVPQDLSAVLHSGIDGVVIPKVGTPEDAAKIIHTIASLEKDRKLDKISVMPSIETAKGVINAHAIASTDERINALVFGVFDFLYDMHMDYDESDASGYAYARAKIPVDAKAAGVHAIDAIWQKVDDTEGLIKDATVAKRLGYSGKSIIHPGQIESVHDVFLPTKAEIEWAEKVVAALEEAMEKGSGKGAVRLEGRMIDAVHYKQAKAILESSHY